MVHCSAPAMPRLASSGASPALPRSRRARPSGARWTSAAGAAWYAAGGWEPVGPTREQQAKLRALERDWGDAEKLKLATSGVAAAAALGVESARARAEHNLRLTNAELATRIADRRRLMVTPEHGTPLAVESERARAEYSERAAKAEIDARIAAIERGSHNYTP